MPLTRLEVRNWQSLRHADIELGDFTVIVGPSSSGKSALIRACKALTSNVRGSGMITRGEKALSVTAWVDYRKVTLERAASSGSYRLTDGQGSELVYTKLNGDVPEAITAALRIDPAANGASPHFASQFDRPYLLDDSGATVARVLGELTKVNTIFEAVRSANRVRLNAASTLKTRKSDLARFKDQLTGYQDLADKFRLLDTAEQHAARADELDTKIEQLERATRMLQLAEAAASKASRLPVVPAPDDMNNKLNRFLDLQAHLQSLATKTSRAAETATAAAAADGRVQALETELHDLLRDAGACPTCGRAV